MCKTWLRLITSPLSPGSDELLPLLFKPPNKGTMKMIFSPSWPTFLTMDPPCDIAAVCCPRVAWDAAEHLSQDKNTDAPKALMVNVTKMIGTYWSTRFLFSFLLSCFLFVYLDCFSDTPPPCFATHDTILCGTFNLSRLCRKKSCPLCELQ